MKLTKTEVKNQLTANFEFPVSYTEAAIICETYGIYSTSFHARLAIDPDFNDAITLAHLVCVISSKAGK